MSSAEAVKSIVMSALEDLNQILPAEERVQLDANAKLFGADSVLSSLSLVQYVTMVEQKLTDHFGRDITLANEKAMSRKKSPFRSPNLLVDYVLELLEEQDS